MVNYGRKSIYLEKKFAEYHDFSSSGVAVSSATAGLHLILMAAGIGPGDEVIIPGLTFVSDANVVCQLGAKPIFADSCGIQDLNVSITDILNKIGEKTKAIVVVHFAGYPVLIDDLKAICEQRKILLIEDVAHAPGAVINGSMCELWVTPRFFHFLVIRTLRLVRGAWF